MNTENIIEINNLVKNFGDVKAVQGINFRVKQGELFAFLGLNGAGKSTTISIMCGQLAKDSGTVEIAGANLDENLSDIKRELGVVFQNSVLDGALTVKENLKTRAALYGITGKEFNDRLKELCDLFDLSALLKRSVGKLSGGQRRRVDVARAILHNPKILILDEPTTGLDPQTRKNVWEVVETLRKTQGMTVFLTTHYMEEAAEADYVVILDNGIVVADGTPLDLKNKYTGDFVTIYGKTGDDVKTLGVEYEEHNGAIRIEVANTGDATALIIKHPELFEDFEITKGKMDDVFLAATGKKLIEGEE